MEGVWQWGVGRDHPSRREGGGEGVGRAGVEVGERARLGVGDDEIVGGLRRGGKGGGVLGLFGGRAGCVGGGEGLWVCLVGLEIS